MTGSKNLKYSDVILHGDALGILKTLPDQLVDCIVTSPPYWGLRDYGTATWEGGDPGCSHLPGEEILKNYVVKCDGGTDKQQAAAVQRWYKNNSCPKCGAVRIDDQLGLEKTPEDYVKKITEIFRECKRVLKDTGTLWLNLGDSYANGGRKDRDPGKNKKHRAYIGENYINGLRPEDPPGIKSKDLIGIPWRVAFSLQADGWYLRSDIIWAKPNPMPESVTDRPTKSHEYIFLFSKKQKYYYDNESIKEKSIDLESIKGKNKRNPDKFTGQPKSETRAGFSKVKKGTKYLFKNKRTVWTVNPKPYTGAHFAVYPEKLIEPCIRAGSPAGGLVLDPFFGSGTTGIVSKKLDRFYIGIELNPEYIKIAEKRIKKFTDQLKLF